MSKETDLVYKVLKRLQGDITITKKDWPIFEKYLKFYQALPVVAPQSQDESKEIMYQNYKSW